MVLYYSAANLNEKVGMIKVSVTGYTVVSFAPILQQILRPGYPTTGPVFTKYHHRETK